MKRLLITIATALTIGVSALAGAGEAQDMKSLSTKLWKSHKASATSLKNQKADLAIVYGGEDVSRKISSAQSVVG